MATPLDDSKMNSLIPTGPWTIYFHSPEETKWTLQTFVNLGSMKTWHQFWSIMEVLKTESFSDGKLFMMRVTEAYVRASIFLKWGMDPMACGDASVKMR